MKTKIKELQTLSADMIGDGKSPNLFFVNDQGVTVTITRDFDIAYAEWRKLAYFSSGQECALEDRKFGCIASVERGENNRKDIIDDSRVFNQHIKI